MSETPEKLVRKVVIAGGGTAGWIAAAALSHHLGPALDITLIESDTIGTVGVGEATIPTQRTFHAHLGIREADFMKATGATFKLGIEFENWLKPGHRYIHSFGTLGRHTWVAPFHHLWLHAKSRGFGGSLDDYCVELKAARADKFYTAPDKSVLNFAYHLDASAYARFLRAFSEQKGVRRVEGLIEDVEQSGETGVIEALKLQSGERIEGDLFIDCTGFRGLLIEQTLKTGFDDWSHWLPMNAAVAAQSEPTGPAVPYTRAIAHEEGWRWRIPLQHRVGNGIVFDSNHLSPDAAEKKLRDAIDGPLRTDPRLIRFRTGRRKRAWNKNCIALGLSSGFLEPLESTSIHLIQRGVADLVALFPYHGVTEQLADLYNRKMNRELEQVRDFLILHYKLTEREDSDFWRGRKAMDIPDTLAERIALFRDSAYAYHNCDELFLTDSWVQVMMGQGLYPTGRHAVGHMFPDDKLKGALDSQRAQIERAVQQLPTHEEFLRQYCPAIPA